MIENKLKNNPNKFDTFGLFKSIQKVDRDKQENSEKLYIGNEYNYNEPEGVSPRPKDYKIEIKSQTNDSLKKMNSKQHSNIVKLNPSYKKQVINTRDFEIPDFLKEFRKTNRHDSISKELHQKIEDGPFKRMEQILRLQIYLKFIKEYLNESLNEMHTDNHQKINRK